MNFEAMELQEVIVLLDKVRYTFGKALLFTDSYMQQFFSLLVVVHLACATCGQQFDIFESSEDKKYH